MNASDILRITASQASAADRYTNYVCTGDYIMALSAQAIGANQIASLPWFVVLLIFLHTAQLASNAVTDAKLASGAITWHLRAMPTALLYKYIRRQ